jgi:hypothetical protein
MANFSLDIPSRRNNTPKIIVCQNLNLNHYRAKAGRLLFRIESRIAAEATLELSQGVQAESGLKPTVGASP